MSDAPVTFRPRQSIEQVEEGNYLAPKFDDDGLIAVVTSDARTGEILMQGYMNDEALTQTIRTGNAHYWSRSRRDFWRKGDTSGVVHRVRELLVDDDQDCIWLRVDVEGGASSHVGYRSCFYRRVPTGREYADNQKADGRVKFLWTDTNKVFDPAEVYGDAPSPTIL